MQAAKKEFAKHGLAGARVHSAPTFACVRWAHVRQRTNNIKENAMSNPNATWRAKETNPGDTSSKRDNDDWPDLTENKSRLRNLDMPPHARPRRKRS